jgi:FkbM family methyltransferase
MAGTLIYVGAHEGHSLGALVDKFDRVHAFEAHPDNVDTLRQRFAGNRKVTVVWAAVTDTKLDGATVPFYLSTNNCSSSLADFRAEWLAGRSDGLKMQGEVQVPSVNLNRYCTAAGIRRIDLYVSDIQGADLMVLRTMEQPYLANGWIRCLQCETTKDGRGNIYRNLPSNELAEFRQLLEPRGYALISTGWSDLAPGEFTPVPDDWWEFDAMWQHVEAPHDPAPPAAGPAAPAANPGAATAAANPGPAACSAPMTARNPGPAASSAPMTAANPGPAARAAAAPQCSEGANAGAAPPGPIALPTKVTSAPPRPTVPRVGTTEALSALEARVAALESELADRRAELAAREARLDSLEGRIAVAERALAARRAAAVVPT